MKENPSQNKSESSSQDEAVGINPGPKPQSGMSDNAKKQTEINPTGQNKSDHNRPDLSPPNLNQNEKQKLAPTNTEKPQVASPKGTKRLGPSAAELYQIPTSQLKGKYEFLQVVGAGGAGVIYKAKQNPLGRIVAIKMVHSHIVSPTSLMRFEKEAKTISTLSHPNIIAIHDFGVSEDEQPYMVMDYIEGVPLSEYIKQKGRLSLDESVDYTLQICDGLSHAHAKGILHRDLKPNNIMLVKLESDDYHVKILDFGLAKLLDSEEDESDHLTKTGETVGTPAYMSPEQVMGKDLDQRTDIYSLGCVIYHCLTGSPPFLGDTKMETMLMHLNKEPEPVNEKLEEEVLDPMFDQLIMRLLAKSAKDRFNNLLEVKESIIAHRKGLFESDPSQIKTLPYPDSDRVAKPTEEKKEPYLEKHRNLILILVGALMLGIPLYALVNPLNRSVNDDAKPAKNDEEEKYRKELDKALDGDSYADEGFISRIEKDPNQKELSTEGKVIKDETLKHLDQLPNLYKLDMEGSPVTDQGIKNLKSSTSIRELNLAKTKITDHGLISLLALPNLTKLNLADTEVTDSGLSTLTRHKNLVYLNLNNTQVTDAALKTIGQLNNLAWLYLSKTAITDNNLDELTKLKLLTELDLSYTKITDKGVTIISSIPNLKIINFAGDNLSKDCLIDLAKLDYLVELNLSYTKLDDSCINNLTNLSGLNRLYLEGCKLSHASQAKFLRVANHCNLIIEP